MIGSKGIGMDATKFNELTVSMVESAQGTETRSVKVRAILSAIRAGRWRAQVERVRAAYQTGGKDAAAEPKKRLSGVLFSGTFSRRNKDALVAHSGLLCVDLDNLDGALPEKRQAIEAAPHMFACFLSPTGGGLKVLVPIEPDPAKHLDSFRAAQRYFRDAFGLEIDEQCKDVSRLCFVSYDPATSINPDAVKLAPLPAETPKSAAPVQVLAAAAMSTTTLTPYVAAAVEDETRAVAETPEGERNGRLNKAAFSLGQIVGAGALARSEIEGLLLDAALRCGLSEREAARTIRSGLDEGQKHPRQLPEPMPPPPRIGGGVQVETLHAKTKTHTAPASWPAAPDEACYCGLAGDIVHALDPHTEADPLAVLVQLLVFFGNCVGRSPHFKAEADRHAVNEFALLVGETSKGRKGTSAGHVRRLFEAVDSAWTGDRIQCGLSSGEGLVWAVRDPITKPGKDGAIELVDPGEPDRRLLALESEFASTLHAIERQGNTLSAAIRNLWDSGSVRNLTKTSPARTTDAHVSLVGHITREELLRYMTRTELANGFCNRFLLVCVRRSKVLPEGGNLQEVTLLPLVHRLKEAIQHARTTNELRRDAAARELWIAVYPKLSEGKRGLLGGILSRSEAHTMRLACIYALLDMATEIRRVLAAA